MKEITKYKLALIVLFAGLLLGALVYNAPAIQAHVNTWRYGVQKADDETRYETRKEIEDSCRAMIASYVSDSLTYEQYKDSDNEEKQSWAEQARMRVNKTAASYNEYVLKNSYVWDGNIPSDIKAALDYLSD